MTLVPFSRFQAAGRMRSGDKPRVIAALDIGSTKVCCLIGEVSTLKGGAPQIKILGMGHQIARGIRAGYVINPEEAEGSIRLAVDQAERAAGITLSDVVVNVSGGRPFCATYTGSVSIGGGVVTARHIREGVAQALGQCDPIGGRFILHAVPVRFDLDGVRGVENPEGLYARTLSVDVNVLTIEREVMRNLALVVARCHLSVSGCVSAPYAAAQVCLTQEEQALGAIVVDLGGGATDVAVFHEGGLIQVETIALGGQHITKDLAQGLSVSLNHAERLKTLSGSVLTTIWEDREYVTAPLLGERGVNTLRKIPRSELSAIIRPRVEEIFELVRHRLQAVEGALVGKRIVLTGGGSQLMGIRDVAGAILNGSVRLATPPDLSDIPGHCGAQSFALCAGLLRCALTPDRYFTRPNDFLEKDHKIGYLRRVGQWIKESF